MSAALPQANFEDLTARARIREAALVLFGERGIEGATLRDIAGRAGVSGGLVRHHFGSKEGLREACDAYARDRLLGIKQQAVVAGAMADATFVSAAQPALLVLFRYLARSVVDGSPSARAMFDEMVRMAEAWLSDHNGGQFSDPSSCAAVLVAMEMGVLFVHDQLSRTLGSDIFSETGHLRLARAKIELYSKPLLDAPFADRALAAVDQLLVSPPPPAAKQGSGSRRPTASPRVARPRGGGAAAATDGGEE